MSLCALSNPTPPNATAKHATIVSTPSAAEDTLRVRCFALAHWDAAHGVGHFGPHEHSSQGALINARVDAYLSAAMARDA